MGRGAGGERPSPSSPSPGSGGLAAPHAGFSLVLITATGVYGGTVPDMTNGCMVATIFILLRNANHAAVHCKVQGQKPRLLNNSTIVGPLFSESPAEEGGPWGGDRSA